MLRNEVTVIPVSLGKQSLRKRLEDYYSLIAPDNIANEAEWKRKFDLIYEKYGESVKGEKALASKLCKKYGSAVRLRLGVDDSNRNKREEVRQESIPKREESWYDPKPGQHNSGVIDFGSEQCDPFAVLSADSSKIYGANSFIKDSSFLDNISCFAPCLPACDPMKRNSNIHRKRKRIENMASKSNDKSTKKLSLLSSIAQTFQNDGPLSLLYTIHIKRQRVRVMIRYNDCIRSTLTGYLLAFDKHMNMILRDVDEVYTPRVTKLYHGMGLSKGELEFQRRTCIVDGRIGFGGSQYNKKNNVKESLSAVSSLSDSESRSRRMKVKQRHCQQILVRGDNVVMVWSPSSERSAWPKTSISPRKSIYNKDITSKEQTEEDSMVGTPGSLLLTLQHKHNKESS
jgi:small nuclear ribonucleoprotein (snRNP)-like protein